MPHTTINTLPAEVQLNIIELLDCVSLTQLRATNHYFHGLPTNNILRKAYLNYESNLDEYDLDDDNTILVAPLMPCYGCFKVKPLKDFSFMREVFGDLFRPSVEHCDERRCTECENKTGHMDYFIREWCRNSLDSEN